MNTARQDLGTLHFNETLAISRSTQRTIALILSTFTKKLRFRMIKSFWMLLASLLFAMMAAFARMGAADFSSLELVFYRSLFGVIVIWAWVAYQGQTVKTPLMRAHLMRSFLGTFALTIWFYAIARLPLGTAMTLNYTSPLYMALIVIVLAVRHGETFNRASAAAVVLGFLGVTLVLKPELQPGQMAPALIGLTSGFFAALAYFQVRELTRMNEPEWRIVFYFTLFGTVWGLVGHLCLTGSMTLVTLDNVPALIGMAVTATGAQLAMTRAWGSDNTLLTAVFQYSAIVFAACFGAWFFDEPIGLLSAIGIALIMIAGVWAALMSRKKKA